MKWWTEGKWLWNLNWSVLIMSNCCDFPNSKNERRDMTGWFCIPAPQSMPFCGCRWPIFTTWNPIVQQEWLVSRDTAYKRNKIVIRISSRNNSVALPINIGNMERNVPPKLFTPLVSECFILLSLARREIFVSVKHALSFLAWFLTI